MCVKKKGIIVCVCVWGGGGGGGGARGRAVGTREIMYKV